MRVGGACFFSILATTNLVYQIEIAHFDPLRLLLIGSILELTCLVFQVPTGLLADTYSRRWAVAIGFVLTGAGFIVEGLFPTFLAIAVAQVIWGLGATLSDGADDAWITDEVGEEKAGNLFLRAAQWAQAGSLVGVVVGVGLATVRLNLPMLVGGTLHALLGIYLFFAMSEVGYAAIPREGAGSLDGLRVGAASTLRALRTRPLIILVLAITVIWGLSGEGFDRLYAIHLLKDIGLPRLFGLAPVAWFGVIAVGASLLGFATTHLLRKRLDLGDRPLVVRVLLGLTAARVLTVAGFAVATSLPVAMACLWLGTVVRRAYAPVQRAWLNQSLDPGNRATLFSVDGQADALGQIIGGPVLGLIASNVSIRAGLLASAALLGLAIPLLRSRSALRIQVPDLD